MRAIRASTGAAAEVGVAVPTDTVIGSILLKIDKG
jgi:hypothetical protein